LQENKNRTVRIKNGKAAVNLKGKLYGNRYLLLMFLPCLLYYIIFRYLPMWGILFSFQDYKPGLGFWASHWVGMEHFIRFFSMTDGLEIIRNTFLLGFYSLLWGFPAPILFALVLNEVRKARFKKVVQTITYMPHFLSLVVIYGMTNQFLDPTRGPVNLILKHFTGHATTFMADPHWFRTIYIATDIWQNVGWGAIIYLAALSTIDPQLYESSILDGANKFKQIIHITLPMISSTIIVLLILRLGYVLDVGFEKVYLFQIPATYETADVISTYVYRSGLRDGQISYATAVGTFNSIISLALVLITNSISKRFNQGSLW
jgi:ABC-type polysaccharide transport system, permease component